MKRIHSFIALLFISFFTHAQNTKPFVIPELREWKGSAGNFTISPKTIIVADASAKKVAQQFAADYKTMFRKTLQVKLGKEMKGGIYFTIDPAVLKEKGGEAYQVEIGEGVKVSANSAKGLYWATRTLLQMAEQSASFPKGKITDYPEYPLRGFMLDAGRKYFSMDFLKATVRLMSYYKMNTFQVHLNDNGFHKYHDFDWNKTQAAFRLESATYPGLAAKDGHYKKAEFRQLQLDALKQGVAIVPEIDAPAHTLAFAHYMPELGSGKYGMDHLDLFNPQTYTFMDGLFKEYLQGPDPVFVNEYVHIGTDEYSNKDSVVVEKFREFTDRYIRYVESFGKKAAVWGALTHARGKTPVKVKDVLMYCWYNGYAEPRDMISKGYDVVSVPDGFLYIVPAAGYYYDYLNIKSLYENWTPAVIGKEVFDEKHPQIRGGMFAVWNDHPGNGISYQDVYHRMFPAMQTLAVKMWVGKNTTVDFKGFNNQRTALSEAPGLNLLGRPAKAAKGVVFELKNPVQGRPLAQSLTDIGYNYRVHFDVMANDNPKGTLLFSSDHSKFYLSDPREGRLGFSRDGYDYRFNYTLPQGVKQHLTIEGTNEYTALFVNGKSVDSLKIITHPDDVKRKDKRQWVQTLVFPLKTAGKFTGTLHNLKVEFL
ncbi:family 20 glycosylhydrolase [Haoranjiania flava]|uniref:Family 20 glycosylhydrolase n=1 Tax=Haoranjiania flava TaxID=1856322 RepID=A0AAE3LJL4_9BACT|nr:family 20 glycosylhydrolase [Haoranjiania flava]MCU7693882.1 family 20 glycosylhydrolase [Haoranjiania flava]